MESPANTWSRIRGSIAIAWCFAFGPAPEAPRPPSRAVAFAVNLAPFALICAGVWVLFGVGWGLLATGALLYHDAIRPVLARRKP